MALGAKEDREESEAGMSIPENFPASFGGQSEFRDQLVSAALRIAKLQQEFGPNAGGFSTFFVCDQEYSIRVRPVQIKTETTSPALSASCGSAAEQLGAGEGGKE